jgi:hypothetical protein
MRLSRETLREEDQLLKAAALFFNAVVAQTKPNLLLSLRRETCFNVLLVPPPEEVYPEHGSDENRG